MDLLINRTAVQCSSRGVQRYFSNVMRHLDWPFRIAMTPIGRWRPLDRWWELCQRGQAGSILWSPAQRGPLRAPGHVITVHDCISLEYTYRDDWRRSIFRLLLSGILENAVRIVAISHATKAAILRNHSIGEDRITVIQSGHNALPAKALDGMEHHSALSMPANRPPFILMVLNALPHKNGPRACQALARSRVLRERIDIRVVGGLSVEAMKIAEIAGLKLQYHPNIDDAELSSLYRECLFLLSPSLDEGHNLPVAEALAHGANVLCSDIPVHREFFDMQASFFDPRDVDHIAAAIDAGLDRGGRWFQASNALRKRTFHDVGHDYRALFLTLAQ